MKQAVLFDLDGTLWDASDTIAPAWNQYCRENGVPKTFTPADCRSYCGRTLPEIAALVFPELPPERREAIVTGCCDAECIPLAREGGKLYPDLRRTLEGLRKTCTLAVVSNCGLGYIEAFFSGNRTGDLFDDYENAVRTGMTKGENIRLVMERNGITRAVYLGDTEGDRRAAEAAGVPFIHAAYGYGQVTACAAAITGLSELPRVLKALDFAL